MVAKRNPGGGSFWQDPAYLKGIRESFHPPLSQQELARKSGVTRAVIANCETGVTPLTAENALVIYMILEAFGSAEAARAILAIHDILRKSIRGEITRIETEVSLLEKRREAARARLAEIEADEKRLRVAAR